MDMRGREAGQEDCAAIRFMPAGVTTRVQPGQTIWAASVQAGIHLNAICGGVGKCGKCLVRVEGGVDQATGEERGLLGEEAISKGMRLACQARVQGPATVWVLDEVAPEKMTILTWHEVASQDDMPATRVIDVELERQTLANQISDEETVLRGLAPGEALSFTPHATRRLRSALQVGNYRVRLVRDRGTLLDVRPHGAHSPVCGAAVDLGTTTVAGMLLNLENKGAIATAATTNKQGAYGEDAVSRIGFSMRDEGNLKILQRDAIRSIDEVISGAAKSGGVSRDEILRVVVVGNTAMGHLLMGVSAEGLTQAPYVPVFRAGMTVTAAEMGMESASPGAWVTILPFIAGFVGADTVGVILAAGLDRVDAPVLAIDIGTNGEVVLALPGGRMLACSAAAGPAFEGAHIDHGMRASQGAITHVSMKDGLSIETVGQMPARGICGTGIMDAVAGLLEIGTVDETGRFVDEEGHGPDWVKARMTQEGTSKRFMICPGPEAVWLSQRDIREVQLAKGAMRAGMEILLKEAGLEFSDLSSILLAGAFGSYVAPWSALRIGLLPPVPLDHVHSIGNAAGVGATMALLSQGQSERALRVARQTTYVEISGRPDFQEIFADAMAFPPVG